MQVSNLLASDFNDVVDKLLWSEWLCPLLTARWQVDFEKQAVYREMVNSPLCGIFFESSIERENVAGVEIEVVGIYLAGKGSVNIWKGIAWIFDVLDFE